MRLKQPPGRENTLSRGLSRTCSQCTALPSMQSFIRGLQQPVTKKTRGFTGVAAARSFKVRRRDFWHQPPSRRSVPAGETEYATPAPPFFDKQRSKREQWWFRGGTGEGKGGGHAQTGRTRSEQSTARLRTGRNIQFRWDRVQQQRENWTGEKGSCLIFGIFLIPSQVR